MKSIAVTEPGKLAIVELPEPQLGPYDVLIKSEVAFICNATDRKVVDGHFPGMDSSTYPLLLGHENVGRVIACGQKVQTFKENDRVIGGLLLDPPGGTYGSGWGGFSQYVVARDHGAMVADNTADAEHGWNDSFQIMRKIPTTIDLGAAGLLCTWREVYAGMFTDFSFKKGQDIIVFGAGPVGLSFIKFARLQGLGRIISLDLLESKRKRALHMGADEALAPDEDGFRRLRELFPHGVDSLVDAVGHNAIIQSAVPLVKMGGSICVYGVLGDPVVSFNKEQGPYNFNLFIHQWPTRSAEAAAQDPLVAWLEQGVLDSSDFITGTYSIDEFSEAFAASQHQDAIKTMVDFSAWH
ncbi:MAG: sorbitol dehydrogenase [Spirochaetia bacterium]|nr:sorbitol dehydrogenase [Spirochaetia bacterium]